MDFDGYIRSIPALAAHLRNVRRTRVVSSSSLVCPMSELVPTYHPRILDSLHQTVTTLSSLNQEADAMVHVFRRLIDHLHRLVPAFAEWPEFDPGAFFDLYPHQANLLVDVNRQPHTARIVFCGDLLLPCFQRAEAYFVNVFTPAYRAAFPMTAPPDPDSAVMHRFRTEVEPEMSLRWQHLVTVAQRLNWSLQEELDFLVITYGEQELFAWRPVWQSPADPGLDPALCPAWETLTTFTLAVQCDTTPTLSRHEF